jgi:HEAT repeat protein
VLGNADSPEIREALLRCLTDANENVREEAAVGLGKRRDKRLVPALRIMLAADDFSVRVGEAAAALAGMDRDPPEWTAEDYRAAIAKIGE